MRKKVPPTLCAESRSFRELALESPHRTAPKGPKSVDQAPSPRAPQAALNSRSQRGSPRSARYPRPARRLLSSLCNVRDLRCKLTTCVHQRNQLMPQPFVVRRNLARPSDFLGLFRQGDISIVHNFTLELNVANQPGQCESDPSRIDGWHCTDQAGSRPFSSNVKFVNIEISPWRKGQGNQEGRARSGDYQMVAA